MIVYLAITCPRGDSGSIHGVYSTMERAINKMVREFDGTPPDKVGKEYTYWGDDYDHWAQVFPITVDEYKRIEM